MSTRLPYWRFSSLPNATKESKGVYKHIYHVDSARPILFSPYILDSSVITADKAVIEDYLKASGVPYAVLLTGWFIENLWR